MRKIKFKLFKKKKKEKLELNPSFFKTPDPADVINKNPETAPLLSVDNKTIREFCGQERKQTDENP